MLSSLFFVVVLLGQSAEPRMTPAQFDRLMASFCDEVKDVAFVYEGFHAGFPEGTPLDSVSSTKPGNGAMFQGSYLMKYDAKNYRTLIDAFMTNQYRKPITETHDTYALIDGKLSMASRYPDQGTDAIGTEVAGPGRLNQSDSPERIFFHWFFKTKRDYGELAFEDQGWEEVDGHRCLRVQLDVFPAAQLSKQVTDRAYMRFWIDLARGGHPLKVEYYNGFWYPGLNMRCHGIELGQVPLPDGRLVWFPVRGRTESFGTTKGMTSKPVGLETYFIVDGTIRFNQNPPDSMFQIQWKGKMPETAALAKLRKEFHRPVRNDPAGIKERLDRSLAEADSQTKQLDASAPQGEGWAAWWSRMAFFGSGVVLLAGTAVWKWRSR